MEYIYSKTQVRQQLNVSKTNRIMRIAGNKCETPGCNIDAKAVHHIIYVKHGGQNIENNLVSLCPNCHNGYHEGSKAREILIDVVNNRSLEHKYQIDKLFEDLDRPMNVSVLVGLEDVDTEDKQSDIAESFKNNDDNVKKENQPNVSGTGKKSVVVPEEKQANIIKSIGNGADTMSAMYNDVGMSQNTRDNLQILIDKGIVIKNDKGRYSLA